MPMRFLIETQVSLDQQISVGTERAHYLSKVMRKKAGDIVDCFDGKGTAFSASILSASSRNCELLVKDIQKTEARSTPSLDIGLALLKGHAMDRALQQATELGAASIYLIQAARSNVQVKADRLTNKLSHWQKIVAGACEQSGHLFIPPLLPPTAAQQVIDRYSGEVVVLDMHGEGLPTSLPATSRILLIGPEGGWDDRERALFSDNDLPHYTLGEQTLRAETTPAVALSLFAHLARG